MKTWQQFSSSRDYLMNTGIFQFTQFPLIPHKAAINCQFNLNPAQIMPYHFFIFKLQTQSLYLFWTLSWKQSYTLPKTQPKTLSKILIFLVSWSFTRNVFDYSHEHLIQWHNWKMSHRLLALIYDWQFDQLQ